jgi:hypothetical protein
MNSYTELTNLVLKIKELDSSDSFNEHLSSNKEMKAFKSIWKSWITLTTKTQEALDKITDIPEDNKKKSTKKEPSKRASKKDDDKKISADDEPKKPRGFMIPKKITDEVAELFELTKDSEMNQPELTKVIVNYSKENCPNEDSKLLKLDNLMREVLKIEDDLEEISQQDLRKHIKHCYV